MRFHYVAYNLRQGLIHGRVEADDETEAWSAVVRQGVKPLRIRPTRQVPAVEELFPSFFQVGTGELLRFLRQLATMIRSGASLQRTLEMLQSETGNRLMRRTLARIRAVVDEGGTLSSALAEHPKVFGPLVASVVEVGEFTGWLAPALQQLADIMEKEQEAKQKAIRTLMMPMVNLAAAAIMLVIMMTVVLPPIFETFAGMDANIPFLMRIAMTVSNGLTDNGVEVFLGLVVGGVAFGLVRRIPSVRYSLDRAKARAPVLGTLTVAGELTRFSRTVGILLESGVSLANALRLGINGCKNLALRRAFVEAEESLFSGRSLTEPLRRHSIVPDMWVELAMIGEQSNSMEQTMNDLANAYEKQAEQRLANLLGVLEPVSTLLVGGVVAFLALANVQMVQSSLSSLGQ